MATEVNRLATVRIDDGSTPVCPDHHVDLRLRGKVGRPARFHDQTSSEYTLIYVCPHDNCSYSESRSVQRIQAAIPGAAPARPSFARVND
ncbi:MAG: hypothetical protein M9953_03875 [Thermomicrobiales bacterium]|nr:hypothetical protein [Thermomicrobiales bacterium]MCO5219847.1 hypothetical protein [Thermomicrobiales bacterium]MCO5224457.1 hypothetical protein [Thermomicrobiales bacterium]MCO5228908.1 hypothetical protein [Thermomicrobiales bacterium]